MASLCLSGRFTGRFHSCIHHFGMTSCSQGIFPGESTLLTFIGYIAIFRTGGSLTFDDFSVMVTENNHIVCICQIIFVRILISHKDLHGLNAAFSQSGILIQAHAQKSCLTYGNMNALCIV